MISLKGSRRHGALAVAIATGVVGVALAQGPGGFGGPGGPPPAFRAMMEPWHKWDAAHPNIRSVRQTLRGLEYIEETPATKLIKPQAKSVLAVLGTWRNKPVMTDAQAKIVNASLLKSLSKAQMAAIMAQPRMGGGPGGPGGHAMGGGPGGPGGPGRGPEGPGGHPMGAGPGGPGHGPGGPGGPGGHGFGGGPIPAPHDYNPLNPATLPFERMKGRAAERLTAFVAALKSTK